MPRCLTRVGLGMVLSMVVVKHLGLVAGARFVGGHRGVASRGTSASRYFCKGSRCGPKPRMTTGIVNRDGAIESKLSAKSDKTEPLAYLSEFASLGISGELQTALHNLRILSPSPIQRAALPRLLGGQHLLLAAGTGSGKTFAYLLPILEALKAEELIARDLGALRRPRRPRAIVLVPTRELAMQVFQALKGLSHYCKISSGLVIGGELKGKQKKALERPIDVLVACPGRLRALCDTRSISIDRITHLVIDEVDTMLTQGFAEDLRDIVRRTSVTADGHANSRSNIRVQVIAATATITRGLERLLEDKADFLPELANVAADDLHKSAPKTKHDFVDVEGDDKMDVLRKLLAGYERSSAQRRKRTMIFCNFAKNVRAVSHALREDGIVNVGYHSEMNSLERRRNLKRFIKGKDGEVDGDDGLDLDVSIDEKKDRHAMRNLEEGEFPILVSTDIAARGLDIPDVRHVINFDFPRSSADYLHRAGRTGRLQPGVVSAIPGKVTSIVARYDRSMAKKIEDSFSGSRAVNLDESQVEKVDSDRREGIRLYLKRQRETKPKPKPPRGKGGGRRNDQVAPKEIERQRRKKQTWWKGQGKSKTTR